MTRNPRPPRIDLLLEVRLDTIDVVDVIKEEVGLTIRRTSTADLKHSLAEASRVIRDYALPGGDRASEEAIHHEMNLMLDELRARGAL